MKLSEKIYYCRKKSGKSQEALAEILGVSRQAVSKWETGDAEPELSKLKLLANTFGVTVDWLLSEEDPADTQEASSVPTPKASSNWVDSIPGVIGKLLKRYGWLAGVYTAISGAGFTLIGALAYFISRYMVSSFNAATHSIVGNYFGSPFSSGSISLPDGTLIFDEYGNLITSGASANSPVSIFGMVIMILGIVLMITGVALAAALKKQSKR